VARTLEFIEEMEILESGKYQVVMFDVLGDVVCGGFAAPLRKGFAEKIVIVTSEEPMSMYAANNICRAVAVYRDNGVGLAGLVANLRGPDDSLPMLEAFAKRLTTRLIATIPRDPKILASERKRLTVVEFDPQARSSRAFSSLAAELVGIDPAEVPLPTPMEDEDFYAFIEPW
jgi:nitrogenase iron protein NifH